VSVEKIRPCSAGSALEYRDGNPTVGEALVGVQPG
jgi:hypothetical protein